MKGLFKMFLTFVYKCIGFKGNLAQNQKVSNQAKIGSSKNVQFEIESVPRHFEKE